MRTIVKILIALGLAAALCGCVIRPWHPHHWRGLADVVAPASFIARG
jgi:hypothetical protein